LIVSILTIDLGRLLETSIDVDIGLGGVIVSERNGTSRGGGEEVSLRARVPSIVLVAVTLFRLDARRFVEIAIVRPPPLPLHRALQLRHFVSLRQKFCKA
jgi:hypothetical protein